MFYENPFTPTFGEIPEHLAGRKEVVADLMRAFTSDRRRPELTSVFVGARGTGKTTLLSVLAHRAEEAGWVAASTTAMPGMLDDLEIQIRKHAQHLVEPADKTAVASIGIPQVIDISFDHAPDGKQNWRSRIEALLEQLAEQNVGLLISVDEVDPNLDEMIELAAVYQHFIRENRKVALIMAGLPHSISALFNDKTVSFLRRAQTRKLGPIPRSEVASALATTITDNGRSYDPDGLSDAVEAIQGFPYLLQLVGYRAWDISPNSEVISQKDFEAGIQLARQELYDHIFEATYRDLSDEDLRFLRAMLEDADESKTGDLVKRLDRSSAQVAQYRKRLIDAGVIGERRRGVVGFDLPYFREFLEERLGVEG